jgi:hypothetical protein
MTIGICSVIILLSYSIFSKGRYSAVGIATRDGLDGPEVESR